MFNIIKPKYVHDRLQSSRQWFMHMSAVTFVLAIAIAIGLAQCKQVSLLDGVALGVVAYLPMLFLLWLPYLGAKIVFETSGATAPTAAQR